MMVHRHLVPIDDQVHAMRVGTVVHVDTRTSRHVEVWALDDFDRARDLLVVGTGQPLPEGRWLHLGSVLSAAADPFLSRGAHVWHLFERAPR